MHLTRILFTSARNFGNAPALTMRMGYRTITLTYAQVEVLAKQVALFLADKGVNQGDLVLLCAPNSPYWIVVWWGCLLRGAYVVPLAVQSTQATVNKIMLQTQPKLCFMSLGVRHLQLTVPVFWVEHLVDYLVDYNPTSFKSTLDDNDDQQIAEIMYTSGTTGDPKGVLLTHHNISTNVEDVQQVFRFVGSQERLLSVLPLSHMLEQTGGFLIPFSVGAHIIYAHSSGAIRDLLKQYHITKMATVPEFLKLTIMRIDGRFRDYKLGWWLSSMRFIASYFHYKQLQRFLFFPLHRFLGGKLDTVASGGSPLDPDVEHLWDTMGIWVLQGYGLTETSPVITINTYDARRPGSVGKPLVHVQLRLGQAGEIEVCGDSIFKGYFKNNEKTKESFTDDGWFKTGDMGFIDGDGFLFIQGRKKYMIKGPGAENIFPEDIEEVLNTVPGVKDSCVVGYELPTKMVEVHAVLLLDNPATDPAAIVQIANEQLASYQHVTGWSVWTMEDFPRSVTRKVKKEEVISWLKSKTQPGRTAGKKATSPLIRLLGQISGVDSATITEHTVLGNDLKFDSLMRVELVTHIEEQCGVLVDERLITARMTVAELEKLIAQGTSLKEIPRAKRWARTWWARAIRTAFYPLLWCIGKLFFSLRVEGLQHLKDVQGPVIVMPNHLTLIDGLVVLLALPARYRNRISFAAGYDVLYGQYRYVAWLAELFFNAFPFPRKEGDHITSGLVNMGKMLDEKYSVVMFPEGKMSESKQLLPLKKGAGLVAVEMDAAIIPVNLHGVEKMVPFDRLIPRHRGVVTVTFGAPLRFARSTAYDQAVETITQSLQQLKQP